MAADSVKLNWAELLLLTVSYNKCIDALDILLYFWNVSFHYEFLYTSVYSIENRYIFLYFFRDGSTSTYVL